MRTWQKLSYSMGRFANTVSYLVFSNRIQFFYMDVVGLGAAVVGPLWTLFGLWNALNDPLTGQLSDGTRSRWGRRLPYLIGGSLPLGVLFFLLWVPPTAGPLAVSLYFFVILFVFDGVYSLLGMAYNALFPEIARTLEERATLSALREGAGLLALIIAFVAAPLLSQSLGYPGMGLALGALTAAGYLISTLGVRERTAAPEGGGPGLTASFRLALGHGSFRLYLVANLMKELIFVVTAATTPFWAKYVLRLRDGDLWLGRSWNAAQMEAMLLGVPFLLAIPALALWRRAARRYGAARSWRFAFLSYLPGLLLLLAARDFQTGLLGFALLAPGLAGLLMLPLIALSDIVDEDQKATGQQRAGIFFGINGGTIKLAYVIQGLLFTAVLPASGFVSGAAEQTGAARAGLTFLLAGTPVLAVLVSLAALGAWQRRSAVAPWPGGAGAWDIERT